MPPQKKFESPTANRAVRGQHSVLSRLRGFGRVRTASVSARLLQSVAEACIEAKEDTVKVHDGVVVLDDFRFSCKRHPPEFC